MVLIFVPRDSEEFVKYNRGLAQSVVFKEWMLTETDVNIQNQENADDDIQEASEDEWENNAADQENERKELKSHKIKYYHKVVVNENFQDHIFILDSIPQKEDAMKKFSEKYIDIYADIFFGLVNSEIPEVIENEIFVLIHWGKISPDECEKKFRDKIKQTRHKYINSFAISSRRKRYFDVTGDKIYLPNSHQEICDIILKFSYGMIKDILFEYVWKHEIDLSDDQRYHLDFYLTNQLLSKLNENATRDDIWKITAIREWNKMSKTIQNNKCHIAHNDKIIALFSYLVTNKGII